MSRMSPKIDLVKYHRDDVSSAMETQRYAFDGVDFKKARAHPRCQVMEKGWVKVHTDLCEVYINYNGAHAREVVYDRVNMMILRDHMVDTLSMLNEDGVIENLRRIK